MTKLNPDFNTCRLCGRWESDQHTGPMLKYSTRHYAHARCGCVRWGREWLDKQPTWIIRNLPWVFVEDLLIMDYVKARISQESK